MEPGRPLEEALVIRLPQPADADEIGSLLDNSLITYGSGMGNGTIHDYNDLSIITTGHHHKFVNKAPAANLWLTQAQLAGVDSDSFADSETTVDLEV